MLEVLLTGSTKKAKISLLDLSKDGKQVRGPL